MKEDNREELSGRRDINSKTIFGNAILCAQFLRDNLKIPYLKDVQPEDIEDVSERYRPYLGTEFESDTVKRIRLHDCESGEEQPKEPLFLISLTEHKSRVDYNVSMQLLKYMMCIWLDYGKEMERQKEGITERKNFHYPTIIPIVYYEGKAPWTADRQFRARISRSELFQDWIPDFTYEVVRLHDYSNEELLSRGDEISLIMLFNKVQDAVDIADFIKLPQERLDEMVKDTPEVILDIIVSVMESLCIKIGVTEEETRECVSKVRERRMGYLFENMEKMDIQMERRNTAEAREEAKRAKMEAKRAKMEAERAKAEVEREKKVHLEEKEGLVKNLVEFSKNAGENKEMAVDKLIKIFEMDTRIAEGKVALYW